MRGKWLKNIESLGWGPVGHKLQISYSPLPPKFAVVAEDSPVAWVPSQLQAPSTLLSIKSRMQSSRVMSLVIMLTKDLSSGWRQPSCPYLASSVPFQRLSVAH